MRELEPVGDRRVFVPEPGDVLVFCGQCGNDAGMVTGNTAAGLEDMQGVPSRCCGAETVARKV